MALSQGNEAQKKLLQDAVDRWWWPALMMFGPNDGESTHSEQSISWKIKRKSNDELRQDFIDATVPQAEFLGVKIPDPELKWNPERGHYDFGDINWDEFWNVVKGNGPCNKQRMKVRTKAHEQGAWVREAAAAYAEKKMARKKEQVA
jgi:ring-1,2-phenylacetyl-CoA epoxidase subunit PaaA